MMHRGKGVALSLLVVGAAAVAGYALRTGSDRTGRSQAMADVGARIVDSVPADATVIDASSRSIRQIPGARRAIERAIANDAREEWEHVTLERSGAWTIVDAIRQSLPYYDGDDAGEKYNGVYVRRGEHVVVLDAIGWAHLEEPLH